jgi:methionyl-tRNA formyltransferase
MGTPQFAVPSLRALAEAGHELVGVVTRTDKPAGRGRGVAAPPVKIAALEMGLSVYQPKRARDPQFVETLRGLNAEAVVVAAYGQILPKEILELPRYGCINVHASLLPAYRGAAPINWAIIHGDVETGVTIMRMDEGMDTGGVLAQESMPIDPIDTAGSLTEKLSTLGARLVAKTLPLVAAGSLVPVAQDGSKATAAPLLKKEDGLIDWTLPAPEIHNRVRGFTPWPGAFTFLDGRIIKVLSSTPRSGSGEPGKLYAEDMNSLSVGTGSGLLDIITIQPEGKKPMTAAEFLRGHRGLAGKKFGARISKS